MARIKPQKVVTVACPRYDGDYRLQQAYRRLWRWVLNAGTAVEANVHANKELTDASSSVVRAGIDPTPGERSDD